MFCSLKADEVVDKHLNPLKILHCLEDVMSEDSVIVADGGDFVGSAAYILRYTAKNEQLVAILLKTGLNNVLLSILFNVVNNIVQHCYT